MSNKIVNNPSAAWPRNPCRISSPAGAGADPAIRDQRFDSTPLGWARYFGQEQLVALLEPLTVPEEP